MATPTVAIFRCRRPRIPTNRMRLSEALDQEPVASLLASETLPHSSYLGITATRTSQSGTLCSNEYSSPAPAPLQLHCTCGGRMYALGVQLWQHVVTGLLKRGFLFADPLTDGGLNPYKFVLWKTCFHSSSIQ